ncbi:topoisomerase DNA-binding C4 zinc finger domain-containing protein [Sphingomonas sp. 3P27F8]|uniref:topoisomerase DNA-binding C4 zinc finger domain-containing protein n=1 Tax=Sphingomonas sp. 3P27F8 TaxID=2502213 RepID=UPI00148585BA|nr:topoisomerase DNA-binding C4 zinc finger domain-containing protein [Sphingomonas sp. 3P27F8]
MRQVAGHQPIHELITTASRREHFPKADYRFLVHVALNVARIVASAHAAGVVIGDINGSGFLVSQRGTVTLIDADSFQVGAHRCPVGMAEFTPPELQGVAFGTIDRTPDHDAFGLAIILFQILALGRHPFAGVARGKAIQIDQAIVKGLFAYSLLRTVRATPPPAALRLDDLPRAIRLLLERAFAGRGYARPTAAEWVEALGALAKSLTPCPNRSDHHVVAERGPCPWCRIERETGRPIFVCGMNTSDGRRVARPFSLCSDAAEAIQHAKRHAGEAVMPMWSRPPASPGMSARKALATIDGRIGQLPPSLRALQLGAGVVDKFMSRNDAAQRVASRILDEWRSRLGVWDIAKLIGQLRGDAEQLDRLHVNRSAVVARATAHFVQETAIGIMAHATLDVARIPGIGAALRAHLVTNGITNAAAVSRPALAAVGGIGEARIVLLLFWREAVAVRAEQSARSSGQANALASAEAAVAHREQQLEHRIKIMLADLEAKVARVRKAVWLVDRNVEAALAVQDQAAADVAYLGLADHVPRDIFATNSLKQPPVKAKSKGGKKRPAKTCPRCGSAMVKRWGQSTQGVATLFLGCRAYPKCKGTRPVRAKGGTP